MTALYLMPFELLAAFIMTLAFAAVEQAFCTVYGFFSFRYSKQNLWESLLNAAVSAQIFMLAVFAAETLLRRENLMFIIEAHIAARYAVFAFVTVFAAADAVRNKSVISLFDLLLCALTLPITEKIAGAYHFRLFLYAAAALFFIRAALCLYKYDRAKRKGLSAFSVKEAVDTMDFGLLFFRADGVSRGKIMLSNTKMQEIMFALTGKMQYDGKKFLEALKIGDVLPECTKAEGQLLYTLPNDGIWLFASRELKIRRKNCVLLAAVDVTAPHNSADRLYEQSRELEKRNKELKEMLGNLEAVCRAEETMHVKGQIHDLLGQRISLLLRCVREHKPIDEELLASFAGGISEEFKNAPVDFRYSLNMLVNNFKGLGITVSTSGELPENADLQKTFFEIAAEAMSNAVRHGYATEINIKIGFENNMWSLTVTDNGIPRDKPVKEGGGFTGMRSKALERGGAFAYRQKPHFTLIITIPEEAAI